MTNDCYDVSEYYDYYNTCGAKKLEVLGARKPRANMLTCMNLLNSVIERGRNISTLLQQYLGDSDVRIKGNLIKTFLILAVPL